MVLFVVVVDAVVVLFVVAVDTVVVADTPMALLVELTDAVVDDVPLLAED